MTIMDMHLHSNYSDGINTLEEMVIAAIEIGLTHITFTDHVWVKSLWVDEYLKHIQRLKIKYADKINIYSGVEAKVIDRKGNIDLNNYYKDKIDFILAAFHRIPLGDSRYIRGHEIIEKEDAAIKAWVEAYEKVLSNPVVNVMAHPFAIFKENNINISKDIIEHIIMESAKANKIFEINIKRDCLNAEILLLIKKYNLNTSIGSDSHSVEDIFQYKDKILYWNKYKNI